MATGSYEPKDKDGSSPWCTVKPPSVMETPNAAAAAARNIRESDSGFPRRYTIDQLKSIGEDGIWDQGTWVSWKDVLEMGGLGADAKTDAEGKGEEKDLKPEMEMIKPVDKCKYGEVGA